MSIFSLNALPSDLAGGYDIRGRYRMAVSTTGTTVVAARTTTAGHLFALRWAPAVTGVLMFLRYFTAKFILTTAYGTAQETGCDLIVARGYTVAHTGGTAIDTGGTLTGSGKRRTAQAVSLVNDARIHVTGALTAGTHTLDASPIGIVNGFSSAIGITVPETNAGPGVLWDSRFTGDHLMLATSEGLVARNLILMGATGVGRWDFTLEWDEGTPNGQGRT